MNIERMGTNVAGCKVYLIEGKGYWVAPKHITLSRYKERQMCSYQKHGDSIRFYFGNDLDQFLTKLKVLLEKVDAADGIWLTSSRAVERDPAITPDKRKFRVITPACINGGTRGSLYLSSLKTARKVAADHGIRVREMYSTTVDEAMTFHEICPHLRKTS